MHTHAHTHANSAWGPLPCGAVLCSMGRPGYMGTIADQNCRAATRVLNEAGAKQGQSAACVYVDVRAREHLYELAFDVRAGC